MIIRSQDKERITNDLNLYIVMNGVVEGGFFIKNNSNEFGLYSTKEKAIKVLDMIEDAHRSMSFTDGVVFRMPDDEDVEV